MSLRLLRYKFFSLVMRVKRRDFHQDFLFIAAGSGREGCLLDLGTHNGMNQKEINKIEKCCDVGTLFESA